MAYYLKYQTADGDAVLVEIEGEPETAGGVVRASRVGDKVKDIIIEAQNKLEDAMDSVRHSAQAVIAKVKSLGDPPDEVEVTFGLKAAGEAGNFAVAKVGTEASYTVTLKWKRETERKARLRRGTSRRLGS